MSQRLADDLPRPSGANGIRVWLKSSGYARRLLLGEAGDPWESAANYLAFFNQAHGLLKPDVAELDVGELYRSWVVRHPELKAEMGAKKRTAFPLKRMLEEDDPRRLLAEVVEAVVASLRGQTPLVLTMPAPRQWLAEASQLAGRGDVEVDDDTVEDGAMYMADLLRAVSGHPIGGLLLDEGSDGGETVDIEAYRPLINVARHYRWGLALRTRPGRASAEFDTIISAPGEAPPGDFAMGCDISVPLWANDALPVLESGQYYFAEIPVAAQPEAVLQHLARMRG
ncbi:hypothetical protein ACT6QH_11115 [Xanthobacter sp. TB0139]|uniref:hypothetical protein n=1 Tax=Xanthobacter sp. TB0139 TaxID=3459178 RepID=UPI004039E242